MVKVVFVSLLVWIVLMLVTVVTTFIIEIMKESKVRQFFSSWFSFYLITLVLLAIPAIYFDIAHDMFSNDKIENLIAEYHGLLLDLLLFGILFRIYDLNKEKKDLIRKFQEELEDYKYWKGEESTYRRIGIIRRLISKGVHQIDLTRHFFEDGKFREVIFNHVILRNTKFNNCGFERCTFSDMLKDLDPVFTASTFSHIEFADSDLGFFEFNECQFSNTSFRKIDLSHTALTKGRFRAVKFEDCDLHGLSFREAVFYGGISFYGCDLTMTNFNEASFYDYRRDTLAKEFEKWIGVNPAKKLLDKYAIINFDDPDPRDVTALMSIRDTVIPKYAKKKKGCYLQKLEIQLTPYNP